MAKGTMGSLSTFLRNMGTHVGRVLTGRERVGEAVARVRGDSAKLKERLVAPAVDTKRHREAVHQVKKGRHYYNKHEYGRAEKCFRQAIECDPRYALAYTYLGHTMYHLGDTTKAVTAWERACALDPTSEAGMKAQEKLLHMKKQENEVISQLRARMEERL